MQILEQPEHLGARRRVEVAGGLVGEDHSRLGDQGACDGDALLLAPGELTRTVVGPSGQAHDVEGVEGAPAPLRRTHAGVDERELDVPPRRQIGEQVELLEDEADEPIADYEATRPEAPSPGGRPTCTPC
jgi:hypothetical protein